MSEYNSDSSYANEYDSVGGLEVSPSKEDLIPAQQRRSSAPQPYHHRGAPAGAALAKGHRRTTDDTASDASDMAGPYEVIEYDLIADDPAATAAATGDHQGMAMSSAGGGLLQRTNNGVAGGGGGGDHSNSSTLTGTTMTNTQLLIADLQALHIQDDSPAAAALRANASIKVSRTGKAARAVHMQTVRKIVKRATGTTKSGVARGKPPRLPPTIHEGGVSSLPNAPDPHDIHLEPISENLSHEEVVPQHPEDSSKASADPRPIMERQDSHIPEGVVAGTVEAGNKVLDQVDAHDLLKLLRWRRSGKHREKKQKSYVKGKVIDGEHELYTLSIAVMIGVRTSISRTNTELNSGPGHRWVKPMDFRAAEKYEFRPKGDSMTPPHMLAHTFKFKDYSPVIFAYLRRMFGVNEFDFLLSVCGNANFIEFISNAKSGQFFFYSNDGRYMIKTMTNAESKFLRRILPDYFRHCAENPNTTITRFFGMYRVKLYHLRRNVKFVIMNSVYYTDKYLQNFFDLKGSSVGRDSKPGDAVKKDNDLRRGLPGDALALPAKERAAMRRQLESDCSFLEKMGVMDYSMLVGVHHIPADAPIVDNKHPPGSTKTGGATAASPVSPVTVPVPSVATLGFRGSRVRLNSHGTLSHAAIDASETSEHSAGVDVTPITAARQKEPLSASHLSETIGAFFYENGLDDDDSSYLDGFDGKQDRPFNEVTELKKQATIEKLYWPFHRYFDIHGHRLLEPAKCMTCSKQPCGCPGDRNLLRGYNIPKFVAPISTRKDRGLEMETSGLSMPMKFHGPPGTSDQYCNGKIFFMGIIDVLQEYSSRKILESTYRSLTTSRNQAASCVAPPDYAQRFVSFFDEYTQPLPPEEGEDDEEEEKISQSIRSQYTA